MVFTRLCFVYSAAVLTTTCCLSDCGMTTPNTGIVEVKCESTYQPSEFDNATMKPETTSYRFDESRTPKPLNDGNNAFVFDMTLSRRALVQGVTGFVCGEQGFCNESLSSGSQICSFECLQCQCDPMCQFYGDCCPDVFFEDSSYAPPPSFPFLNCFAGTWTKWGNLSNIFMVSLCPAGSDAITTEKCERPDIFDKDQATPVSDVDTGVTYRNIFCSKCHTVLKVKPWRHNEKCEYSKQLQKAKSKAELWNLVMLEKSCKVTTTPPVGLSARGCYLTEIDSCNVTGKWQENVNPVIERLCELYSHPIDYYGSTASFDTFRNVFCAVCNGAMSDTPSACVRVLPEGLPFPLSVLLDFNSDSEAESFAQERTAECPGQTVFDRFSNSCRAINCPQRRILVGTKCESTFTSAAGLGFLLRTVLRPLNISQQIPVRNVHDMYLNMIKRSLIGYQPLIFTTFVTAFYSNDQNETKRTTMVLSEVKILSNSEVRLNNMDTALMNIMTSDWTFNLNNGNFTVTSGPRACPDIDDVTVGYTLINETFSEEPVQTLSSDCHILDCLSNVTYIPIQLLCPFVEYNLTNTNFTFDSNNNTIYFNSHSFALTQSQHIHCGDILKVCVDVIVNINVVLGKNNISLRRHVADQDVALSVLSLICIGLSLVCLFLTFLVYSLVPRLRTLPGKNTMALVFHLFWAQLLFLSTSNRTANSLLCKICGVLVHYLWLSSFSWMSVCGYHMQYVFTTLRANDGPRSSGLKRLCFYSALSTILPLGVIGSCLAVKLVETDGLHVGYGGKICFLNGKIGILVFFAGPLGLMLFANAMFFGRTVLAIRSVPDMSKSSNASNKQHVFVYLKLSLLFGFTWIFGILAAIFDSKTLWYVFVVMTGSQGTMLFVGYCANKRTWKMLSSRFSNHEMTSSEVSLRSGCSTTRSTLECDEMPGNQKFKLFRQNEVENQL